MKALVLTLAALAVIAALPLLYTLVTGDFPGAGWFYGLQEDDPFVSFVFSIRGV